MYIQSLTVGDRITDQMNGLRQQANVELRLFRGRVVLVIVNGIHGIWSCGLLWNREWNGIFLAECGFRGYRRFSIGVSPAWFILACITNYFYLTQMDRLTTWTVPRSNFPLLHLASHASGFHRLRRGSMEVTLQSYSLSA